MWRTELVIRKRSDAVCVYKWGTLSLTSPCTGKGCTLCDDALWCSYWFLQSFTSSAFGKFRWAQTIPLTDLHCIIRCNYWFLQPFTSPVFRKYWTNTPFSSLFCRKYLCILILYSSTLKKKSSVQSTEDFFIRYKLLSVECAESWIACCCTKLFFDTKKLVVLCHSLGTGRCTGLDLAGI